MKLTRLDYILTIKANKTLNTHVLRDLNSIDSFEFILKYNNLEVVIS